MCSSDLEPELAWELEMAAGDPDLLACARFEPGREYRFKACDGPLGGRVEAAEGGGTPGRKGSPPEGRFQVRNHGS